MSIINTLNLVHTSLTQLISRNIVLYIYARVRGLNPYI
jgi:hypothetical protein